MPLKHQLTVRSLQPDDWVAVVGLDAQLTGAEKGSYWKQVLDNYLSQDSCLGLAAELDGELAGYLFGELRAFEFGSELCGWVFSLGVQPGTTRQGVASGLLAKARDRFLELGVTRLRTMVHRTDVPLLALFRSQNFVGGPFVQLELDMAGAPMDPSVEGVT